MLASADHAWFLPQAPDVRRRAVTHMFPRWPLVGAVVLALGLQACSDVDNLTAFDFGDDSDPVESGTPARVRLTAGQGEPIEETVDTIYPSAELRDDQNVFVAKIEVDNSDGKLRPGMRGDAIAYGPLRPWLWSLARSGWEKTLWWIGY